MDTYHLIANPPVFDLSQIQAIVFDFDGVFTDNMVWVDEHGQEMVRCCRADGIGLARLREKGIALLVLSGEENPVVRRRCEKLGLEALCGVKDKLGVLLSWLQIHHIDSRRTVYLGNDINDLQCLLAVGLPVIPADVEETLLHALDRRGRVCLTLGRRGGHGVVRELCDEIVASKERLMEGTVGLWPEVPGYMQS